MAGDKVSVTFEIQADAEKMLEYAAAQYGIPDKHKALPTRLEGQGRQLESDIYGDPLRTV